MKEHSKIRIYKKIIIKILREKKLTIEELVTSLNEILKNDLNISIYHYIKLTYII